jgi:hypothetical protein
VNKCIPLLTGSLVDYNICIVVADSLRYDVAEAVHPTFLSAVTTLHRCAATGNFTLPAHAALFSGFLPLPVRGIFRIGTQSYPRLIRSMGARPAHKDVGLLFRGPNVIEAWHSSGRVVLGTGGVQFFNPDPSSVNLGRIFPSFVYEGPALNVSPIDPSELHRAEQQTAIPGAQDALRVSGTAAGPWLLFVNSAATHFPYASRGNPVMESDRPYLEFILQATRDKQWPYATPSDLRDWGIGKQTEALRVLDRELELLITHLRGQSNLPILLLVLADHGEAFGESGFVGHGVNTEVVLEVPLWVGEILPN